MGRDVDAPQNAYLVGHRGYYAWLEAPGRRGFILGLALFWLIADQLTKWLVVQNLALQQSWSLPANLVLWTHVHNRGGAFGLFPGASLLFLGTGLLVTALLLWSLPQARSLSWPTATAYGLILGGAVGNLLDRFRFGYVVDFIDLNFWPLVEWPVFNVADIGISAGIALLVLGTLWPVGTAEISSPASERSSTRSESPG